MTGIKLNHVPYRGSGQATTDLLGGQVPVSIPGTAGMVGHIKAGKLRALAVTGAQALAAAARRADGDRVRRCRVRGVRVAGPAGAQGHAGGDHRHASIASVLAVLATPEVKTYMANAGIEIVGSTPAEFGAFFRAERDQLGEGRSATPAPRSTDDDATTDCHDTDDRRRSPASSTGRTRATCACSCGRSSSASPDGKPAVLFVHGSSMASQPTFDLTVPGRPDSSVMDWFAQRGFVCWCVDMEGYGRSDKTRDIYLRHRQRRRRPRGGHRLHRAHARRASAS